LGVCGGGGGGAPAGGRAVRNKEERAAGEWEQEEKGVQRVTMRTSTCRHRFKHQQPETR
jgi:hypothetical protein